MNQKPKLVKPNRAVITRTIMPAKPVTTLDRLISVFECILAAIMIALIIALISFVTGCTTFIADQFEQDIATSTIAPRLSQIDVDNELAEFRRQSKHANETLAAMKAYAAEGGVR